MFYVCVRSDVPTNRFIQYAAILPAFKFDF